jgi:hypothetical protein
VSFPQRKIQNVSNPPPRREERKSNDCDKNLEIEKIKRQIYNVLDKLESLKEK